MQRIISRFAVVAHIASWPNFLLLLRTRRASYKIVWAVVKSFSSPLRTTTAGGGAAAFPGVDFGTSFLLIITFDAILRDFSAVLSSDLKPKRRVIGDELLSGSKAVRQRSCDYCIVSLQRQNVKLINFRKRKMADACERKGEPEEK